MPNDKQVEIVWIDGQPYAKNHPVAKAHYKSLARLGGPIAEPGDASHALDKNIRGPTTGEEVSRSFHILIVRYGRKLLGSDVLPFAYKSVRDEIAMKLLGGTIGQLDDDPRLSWDYQQIKSKTTGTHILITETTKG